MGAIAGVVPRPRGMARESLIAMVTAMRRAMRRRAPIDGGMAVAYDASVALAHGGSIGPAAEAVLQPLTDERGGLWLVADGEPSNAANLRLDLIGAGHKFRSACGSEVILHLYEQDGVAALERLAGSFAFALWDRERHELVLGRDRFGSKPLYLAERAACVAFASQVGALADADALDPAAIGAFLTLGYLPEPLTIAAGVRAVEPGTIVRIRGAHVRTDRFWEEPSVLPTGDGAADHAQLGCLLRAAVESSVAGEEPIGVALDDGIGSAALRALVQPQLGRGVCLHRFAFAEGGDRGVERTGRWRRLLGVGRAEKAGVGSIRRRRDVVWAGAEEREHRITPALMGEALDAAATGDQPSIGAPLSELTARALRSAGERVWLSPLAAPALLGWPRAAAVSWLWRANRHGSARVLTRAGTRVASRFRPFGRAARIAAYLDRRDSVAAAYLGAHGLCAPAMLATVLRPDALAEAQARFDAVAYLDGHALRPPGPPWVLPARSARAAVARAVAGVELGGPLMSGALRDAEGSATGHGLALRIPLLDHRLLEWLAGGAGETNSPLMDVLGAAAMHPTSCGGGRRLPPLAAWMRGAIRPLMEERLFTTDPEGLFEERGIGAVWSGFLAGRVGWRVVWSLAMARGWVAAHRGGAAAAGRRDEGVLPAAQATRRQNAA